MIVSGSNIMPCIKIDKPLVVTYLVMLCNDDHKNVAHVMTNLKVYTPKLPFQSNINRI